MSFQLHFAAKFPCARRRQNFLPCLLLDWKAASKLAARPKLALYYYTPSTTTIIILKFAQTYKLAAASLFRETFSAVDKTSWY